MPSNRARTLFRPWTRVRGTRNRYGRVLRVAELRGTPVVYVLWDRTHITTPARREAVPASCLRVA